MKNHYEYLDISYSATEEEIKKAYRRMAMKWHPDRNPGDKSAEEKFKNIQKSYETLSDPYKRNQYDISLKEKSSTHSSKNTNSKSFDQNFNKQFDDIFNEPFSSMFGGKPPQANQLNINISFWEAIFGCKKTFEFSYSRNGKKEKSNIALTLPVGTNQGEQFIVDVNGLKFQLTINIESDHKFTRNNLDLFTTIEVPFTLAALGGKLIFPHWTGNVEIIIPPCLKNQQNILISNRGVKRDIFIGDLYLVCDITVPKKLTTKQKELLEAFKATESDSSNIFENIKNTWKNLF